MSNLFHLSELYPLWTKLTVKHDGFSGFVIGYYITKENRPGLVLQMNKTKVVYVY